MILSNLSLHSQGTSTTRLHKKKELHSSCLTIRGDFFGWSNTINWWQRWNSFSFLNLLFDIQCIASKTQCVTIPSCNLVCVFFFPYSYLHRNHIVRKFSNSAKNISSRECLCSVLGGSSKRSRYRRAWVLGTLGLMLVWQDIFLGGERVSGWFTTRSPSRPSRKWWLEAHSWWTWRPAELQLGPKGAAKYKLSAPKKITSISYQVQDLWELPTVICIMSSWAVWTWTSRGGAVSGELWGLKTSNFAERCS